MTSDDYSMLLHYQLITSGEKTNMVYKHKNIPPSTIMVKKLTWVIHIEI